MQGAPVNFSRYLVSLLESCAKHKKTRNKLKVLHVAQIGFIPLSLGSAVLAEIKFHFKHSEYLVITIGTLGKSFIACCKVHTFF